MCHFLTNSLAEQLKCDLPDPYITSLPSEPYGCINRGSIKIITITHGGQSDPYWEVVEDGVLRAGSDLRVQSSYRTTSHANDFAEMAQLIDRAVAEKPAGLVLSFPNEQIIGPHIRAAVEAGIPVITIQSGSTIFHQYGVLHHVGQVDSVAGYQGCQRLLKINPLIKVILIPNVGTDGVNARAAGCLQAAKEKGANSTIFDTSVDLTSALRAEYNNWAQRYSYNSSQIAMLAMDDASVIAAENVAIELHFPPNSFKIGTFDFSNTAATKLTQGFLSFAIHQQQYLQGYLPVMMLTIYASTMNLFAKTYDSKRNQIPLYTGPMFITNDPFEIHQRTCEAAGIIYCDDPPNPDSSVHLKYTLKSTTTACPCIDRSKVNIAFAHHGGLSNAFFWVLENAATQAADDMGVQLDLKASVLNDNVELLSLVLALVESSPKVDGLALTIPDSTFQVVIQQANSFNIPVIAVNAGLEVWKDYGAEMFVGQQDYDAGYQGAVQLNTIIQADRNLQKNNFTKELYLCLDGNSGTVSSVLQRCNATRRWMLDDKQPLPPRLNLYPNNPLGMVYSDLSNPTASQTVLESYVNDLHKECTSCKISGMFAGSGDTDCLIASRERKKLTSEINPNPFYIACFDAGTPQLNGLLDGSVDFTIDQQQWLQGYFPVVFLTLKKLNGNYPVFDSGVLYTGPAFLQAKNVPYKQCENLYDNSNNNAHFVGWTVCPRPNPFTSIVQKISVALGVSVYVISAILFVVIVATSAAFFHYKNTKLVRASTMMFCQMMLFFMVLMLISAILFVSNPTKQANICGARPWIITIGVMGVLAPLFAKTSRLATLFNNTAGLKKIKITNAMLLLEIAKAMFGPILVLIVWFCLDIPRPTLVEIFQQQEFHGAMIHTTTTYQDQCSNDMRFVWVLVAYVLGYVLYGSNLAYQTRNVPEAFNESKSIGISLYFILIMGAMMIGLLALVKTNRNAVAVLIGYGLIITVMTVWSTIFGTKLMILVKGQGNAVSVTNSKAVLVGTPATPSVANNSRSPNNTHQDAVTSPVSLQAENLQLKAELKEAKELIAELKKQQKTQEHEIVTVY